MIQYVFDGSFIGLLCCVFESYEMRERNVAIVWDKYQQPSAFDDVRPIFSDETKADRVWKKFTEKTGTTSRSFFYAYLSEQPQILQTLFQVMLYIFDHRENVIANYGNKHIQTMMLMAKKVGREKHRMEAFVHFKKESSGLFIAWIDPDFNVLPLIARHFKNRYADQQWLIYDTKRKTGIFYDKEKVLDVNIIPNQRETNNTLSTQVLDSSEELYDILWQDYFKSTNITERKNMKLHLQHVPKRYWKYLNEKKNSN